MLGTSFFALALAAAGVVQGAVPEGMRAVYITSNVDTKYVVVPKTPLKAGTTLVVFVSLLLSVLEKPLMGFG